MRFCEELSEAAVLTTEYSLQVTVLHCYGRLVHGDGAQALRQAVMSQDENHFAIDLSGVAAIDAAGLGVLAELEKWATARGGAIQLLNPSARVLEVLKATGLNSVIEICLNARAAGEGA